MLIGKSLPADYSLSERDADVLALIETEDLAIFTFDGLKRRTGLHSETLSRILSRLEEEGIVKKEAEGYRVTPKITELKLQQPHKEEQAYILLLNASRNQSQIPKPDPTKHDQNSKFTLFMKEVFP